MNIMYVCLEGVKGSGKSTVMAMLCSELRALNITFSTASPTKSQDDHSFLEIAARHFTWLRSLDAFNEILYAHRSNRTALQTDWSAPVVLGDRSIVTSYVTRWNKWNSPLICIARVDRMEFRLPAPDHIIYLLVSPATALMRLSQRSRNYGKQDETPKRICDALTAYDEIRLRRYHIPRLEKCQWHVVDANQTLDEVFSNCLKTVLCLIRSEV